ncbi:MAG: hypothetical protein HKO79_03200 [Desulfobacterales bacterium]|nr:chalcone isomerase family protein [Deltaproteobacteria bacterium]NNK85507.1 hypothetical protein [Desulfobacterales bacterium]NNL41473.1 hypothetical protein [Desulfobacterales bacterium]
MKTKLQILIAFIFCSAFFVTISTHSVYGAQIEGVSFKDSFVINGKTATLRGAALLRYMIFIKAYVCAFYLNENFSKKDALGNVERRLIIHYFHAISAEDFVQSTTRMIEKNVSPDRFKALQPEIRQLNNLYLDVNPGDEILATYIPGIGTELALNDKSLGVVPGEEYSAAFFSIWLGKNPIDKGFRKQLLGK